MTGLLGDLGCVYKTATPTSVHNAVWGICDFLAALSTDGCTRTHPSSY